MHLLQGLSAAELLPESALLGLAQCPLRVLPNLQLLVFARTNLHESGAANMKVISYCNAASS